MPQLLSTDPKAGQLLSTDPTAAASMQGRPKTRAEMDAAIKDVEASERERTSAGARALPTIGGMAGGIVGGIPGAAAGGAVGDAARQVVLKGNNAPDAPQSLAESAKDIALSGVAQGAGEAAGVGVVKGLGGLSKWLMNRATTRITAQLAREFPELSDTLIDNALTVSEGGYTKAVGLLRAAKSKAGDALKIADAGGAVVPVEMSPTIADSLKTALLEKAVKSGRVAPPAANQPVTTAFARLDANTKALFQQIDQAAASGASLDLKPSEADLLKTQLQRESRKLYLNRFAPNGPKAMDADATVLAEFASKLNDKIDGIASGYKAANKEAQPLIGATRGLKQAIRPSGNLYQALIRPAAGALLGGEAGRQQGGATGAAVGTLVGGALGSPAGLSRAAIALGHPAVQALLSELPKPLAQAVSFYLQRSSPVPQAAQGVTPEGQR